MMQLVKTLAEMPYLMTAINLQQLGFSKHAAYAILNMDGMPVIHVGKKKCLIRDKFEKVLDRLIDQKIDLHDVPLHKVL